MGAGSVHFTGGGVGLLGSIEVGLCEASGGVVCMGVAQYLLLVYMYKRSCSAYIQNIILHSHT